MFLGRIIIAQRLGDPTQAIVKQEEVDGIPILEDLQGVGIGTISELVGAVRLEREPRLDERPGP